jgi:hypothetical protein
VPRGLNIAIFKLIKTIRVALRNKLTLYYRKFSLYIGTGPSGIGVRENCLSCRKFVSEKALNQKNRC